jgi:hypothetical protein
MPFLRKAKKMTTAKIIAYYSAKFAFQYPFTKCVARCTNCLVFFYSEGELKKILFRPMNRENKIIPVPQGALLDAGYIVISQVN